jgi:hypothetical protein
MNPFLIDGFPWGWGAIMVETLPKGTPCPSCGKKYRKAEGLHRYLFGEPRCTPCATAWCKANWPPPERRVVRRLKCRAGDGSSS